MDIVVYAIGGNALAPPQEGSSDHRSSQRILSNVIDDIMWLRGMGYNVVITHGNGPQVGALMMGTSSRADNQDLHECVAVTQEMIGQELAHPLKEAIQAQSSQNESIDVIVVTTKILVDADDPSFHLPTKPIGPILSIEDLTTRDWDIANTIHGPRRVVASPIPLRIIEIDTIRELVGDGESDILVICCGGGGIPVIATEQGLEGATGVIDKDLASALLAVELGAVALVIATEVDGVYHNHGQPSAERVMVLDTKTALKGVEEKEFPPGSMGPKVQACVEAAKGGMLAFICESGRMKDVFQRRSGTLITN